MAVKPHTVDRVQYLFSDVMFSGILPLLDRIKRAGSERRIGSGSISSQDVKLSLPEVLLLDVSECYSHYAFD